MRSRLAFHENGRSLTSGWVGGSYAPQNGSGLGKVFLFVAVRRGVTPPGSARPLYTLTALPGFNLYALPFAFHTNTQPGTRHIMQPKMDHIQPICGVIHRIGQEMSGLQISCILDHTQRNLIIYRILHISHSHRLRIT